LPCSTTRLIAEGTPEELKRLVPGGHIRMRFAAPEALAAAADALSGSIFDDEALALHVPGDGDVASLHALLYRLDAVSIHAEHLTVHTPDLDDVFALTGHAEVEGIGSMNTRRTRLGFRHDAAATSVTRCATLRDAVVADPGDLPVDVRVRLGKRRERPDVVSNDQGSTSTT
jgi:hypothetical protein